MALAAVSLLVAAALQGFRLGCCDSHKKEGFLY